MATGFSDVLEQARIKDGKSQAWVAEHADISVRHYQNLISGNSVPTLPTALRLAKLLEISIDVLRDELVPDESKVYRNPSKKTHKGTR